MTHRIVYILLAFGLSTASYAQLLDAVALDSVRTYRSLEFAQKDPDHVYRLDLSGQKLKEIPAEIQQFKNLNALDLGQNKLKDVPNWLGDLSYLQELRISKNKLDSFPDIICKLHNLKRLDLSRNEMVALPPCIGELKELMSLDLWSNDLAEFPVELEQLKALRYMDLRAIMFEVAEMDRIQELVPRAKVYFSQPCNCGM